MARQIVLFQNNVEVSLDHIDREICLLWNVEFNSHRYCVHPKYNHLDFKQVFNWYDFIFNIMRVNDLQTYPQYVKFVEKEHQEPLKQSFPEIHSLIFDYFIPNKIFPKLFV